MLAVSANVDKCYLCRCLGRESVQRLSVVVVLMFWIEFILRIMGVGAVYGVERAAR